MDVVEDFYTLRRYIRRCHSNRCDNNLEPEFIPDNNEFHTNNITMGEREEVQEVINEENDETNEDLIFYLHNKIIRTIARLQSKGSMNNVILNNILHELNEVTLDLASFLKKSC